MEENEAVDSEFSQDVFGDENDWIPNNTEEAFPDTPVSRSSIRVALKVGSVIHFDFVTVIELTTQDYQSIYTYYRVL